MSEHTFPTISDLQRIAAELVERGLGELPVQIVVAPDSTLQALARDAGALNDAKPALMIEYGGGGGRQPVGFITTDRLGITQPRRGIQ